MLQLAGGFGVGPIEKLFTSICSIEQPLDVVVVSGRNEKLKKQLDAADVPARHRAKVMGFTDKMDELMAAADVVVTKPGGLTSSEVLARGAAMAIVNPIPGQESRNSDYLLEHGAARLFADAEAIYSYEGTNEMNTLIVGKAITGQSAFV